MTQPFTADLYTISREVARSIEDSPHAERLLHTLCREVGPRPAGSAGMTRARALLADEWRALGAGNVHTEDVPLKAWEEGQCLLEISAPAHRQYDCVQCVNSASRTVSGQVVDGGKLDLPDLLGRGDRLRDAIVLVKGFDFTGGKFEPLQKRLSLAQAAGAAAVLLIGSHPDLPAIFFISRVGLPVLNISASAGKELGELCARGEVQATLKAGGRPYQATCANLIGELGDAGPQREIIATCAHLDGFFNSPGAIDDLTGIIAITEIARALAPYRKHFPRALHMIAFTGEEQGYAGSKQYVREHAAELDRIRFLYSLDCLFESTAKGVGVIWSPETRALIAQALATQPEIEVRDIFAMSSDYLPFMLQGVPAGKPSDWRNTFPAWTHTIADTDDHIPLAWIKSNAIVAAQVLLALLLHPGELPGRRHTQEEVFALIEEAGAGECLRWQIGLP